MARRRPCSSRAAAGTDFAVTGRSASGVHQEETPLAECSCRDAEESLRKLEKRCQPKRIKNPIARPDIEEVPSPARVVRGLFRRTSQKPINAARPTARASDEGCASLERSADRNRRKLSTVSRLDCSSLRSAVKMSDRVGACLTVARIGSVSLPVALGWRGKADPGSFVCKRTSRSPRQANWLMKSRLPQSPMRCQERRPTTRGRP